MSIRILTDTTADITPEEAAEWNIELIPMRVFFGEESYLDGVDMTKDQFYKRLADSEKHPTTSQPSTQEFADKYKKMVEGGASEIIYIHMSKNFSNMYESALEAVELSGVRVPVTIYDSNTLSGAMGSLVLTAAKMAKSGASHDAIITRLDEMREKIHAFLLFDDLKYFARSGRADKIQNFMGTGGVLNTKHIFHIKNGEFAPAFQVRSFAKGMKKLLDLSKDCGQIEDVSIAYTTNRKDAEFLQELLLEFVPAGRVRIHQASPVLGSHGGPNTVGIAYCVR